MFDPNPTVVAELTPSGRGAVAVVVVAGPAALGAVSGCFVAASGIALDRAAVGRILFGRWGGAGGEELVVCRRAAEVVEVHCHGGEAAVSAVIGSLVKRGCRQISWQEWLQSELSNDADARALVGEHDAIRDAAQIALAAAPTARTAAILLDQWQGALSQAIRTAHAAVIAGDWNEAATTIDGILRFNAIGMHLTRPWRVVLSGPPNVGKSSLLNAIAGYQRAIVSPQPGTTRDVVTLVTAIEGWPVEFADTAGLRAGQDELEAAGISLAKAAAEEADLVVTVSEPARPRARPGAGTPRLATRREIDVVNKIDLLDSPERESIARAVDALAVSAVTGEGIESLLAAIAHALVPEVPPPGAAVSFTREQQDSLAAIRAAIDARDSGIVLDLLQALLAK